MKRKMLKLDKVMLICGVLIVVLMPFAVADVLGQGTSHQEPTVVTHTELGIERLITESITGLGTAGFMGALCWYMLSRALPAKDALNTQQRTEHIAALLVQHTSFATEMKDQRILFQASEQSLLKKVEELVSELAKEREERVEMIRHCAAKTEKA